MSRVGLLIGAIKLTDDTGVEGDVFTLVEAKIPQKFAQINALGSDVDECPSTQAMSTRLLCLAYEVWSRAFSLPVAPSVGPDEPAQKVSSQAAAGVLLGSFEPLVSDMARVSEGWETKDDLNGLVLIMLPLESTEPKTAISLNP